MHQASLNCTYAIVRSGRGFQLASPPARATEQVPNPSAVATHSFPPPPRRRSSRSPGSRTAHREGGGGAFLPSLRWLGVGAAASAPGVPSPVTTVYAAAGASRSGAAPAESGARALGRGVVRGGRQPTPGCGCGGGDRHGQNQWWRLLTQVDVMRGSRCVGAGGCCWRPCDRLWPGRGWLW
jgi:hypothetical protein